MSLRRDQIEVSNLSEPGIFRVNVFTIEWFLFYMSLPLYLLSMQILSIGKVANLALGALAVVSVIAMLIPLAQGSHHALTKKSRIV
ncbi:MAG: hypothetical protein Q7L19_06575 [Pseudohongiella sp.]|nr:hypothetical protein [Pseudohongiella sp.]